MGRTNPTYRRFLDGRRDAWQEFERALRRQATADYERVFTYAERYADAATYLNRTDPDTALLLSMVVGLEAERRQLADRVAALVEDVPADR